jgi:hypothetical protein
LESAARNGKEGQGGGILFVSIATGVVGIILGIVGYALGARRTGSVAVVLCTVAMFLGLLVGRELCPAPTTRYSTG